MLNLDKLRNWLESEEGKESLSKFGGKIEREEKIRINQLERLHKSGKFIELTEKALKKYNSKNYINRWYNRSIEPPETLFSFLFTYSEKYGRKCNKSEWKEYGNVFTSSLFYINGYYFNMMNGQGTVIRVMKTNNN